MSDLFSPRFAPPSPTPPLAPPLPPSRYVNRATTALVRFAQPFIGGSRPSSAQANRADDASRRIPQSMVPSVVSPVSPQTLTHKTGIAISALDISPQRTHAVLAGREILKTVRISGGTCAEEFNLRAAIITYASTHSVGFAGQALKFKDDLAANDVKWSHGNYDRTIATAATNGRIMLYDINRAGVELARLHEHNRQVHKLAFNPHQGYYLLSASQDATLRLWDLRAMVGGRNVMSFRSFRRYHANAEGIRDVKWSPTDGTEFACGTDAGVVERWDFRRDSAPLLKVTAHSKICQSIDWHPDGKHLVSAGADKMVLVWDFSSYDRRQNSPWSFRAPQAVARVRWRPVEWKANAQGMSAWETTQLVTSYNHVEPRVHIWNLQRPNVPFKEIDRYHTSPTDLLWHSEDLLWTVGTEGIFTQTDVHFVPRIQERRRPHCFDVSPDGEITLFVQKRVSRRLGVKDRPASRDSRRGSQGKLSSDEKLSESRSTTDEEAGGSFLGTSFRRRRGRTWNTLSSKSAGNTPPSEASPLAVRKLDEIMIKRAPLKAVQAALHGNIFGTLDPNIFGYLATRYCAANTPVIASERTPDTDLIRSELLRNAMFAEGVGLYRVAQTWRMLNLALVREQRIRVEWERKKRLEERARILDVSDHHNSNEMTGKLSATLRHVDPISPTFRALIPQSGNIAAVIEESASKMTTPLARPIADGQERPLSPASLRLDESEDPSRSATERTGRTSEGGIMFTSATNSPSGKLMNASLNKSRAKDNEQRWQSDNQPLEDRSPLQLETIDRHGGRESPASQVRRLGSADSFLLFSTSSDEGQQKPSLPNSLDSMDDHVSQSPGAEVPGNESPMGPIRHVEFSGSDNNAGPQKSQGPNRELAHMDGDASHRSHIEAGGSRINKDPNTILPSIHTDQEHGRKSLRGNPIDPPSSPKIARSEREASPGSNLMPETTGSIWSSKLADLATHNPFSATNVLARVAEFYTTNLSDVLTPANFLLSLQEFIPHDCIDEKRASSILKAYLLQLLSQGLFLQAANLRNLSYPAYEAVYSPSQYNVDIHMQCKDCRGRIRIVPTAQRRSRCAWACEKCGGLQAPCPMCHSNRGKGWWAWCQGCGHGGHAACLRPWFQDERAGGMCAVEGCLHACVRDTRRERLEEKRANLGKSRAGKPVVRGDDWVVDESKAVERVRGGLASAAANKSAGFQHTEKRVKVVTPSEDGRG